MHLTSRPGVAQDIDLCRDMLPAGFECHAALRTKFADIWRCWLLDGLMQIAIIEDGERPPEAWRIAFGNSIFVTDAFVQDAKTVLAPPVSAQIVMQWLAGHSPVLSRNGVRAANSGTGLNLLILHIGWADQLSTEEVRRAKGKLLEALLFFHSGYQLKELLQEIYSDEERQRGLAAGAQIKNDYAVFYQAHPNISLERHACLIGAARNEVQDGSYLSPLFLYTPPRFFFKASEQEILCLALLDRSDEDAAQLLNISFSAVQKRWRAIYERITAIQPDFFPAEALPCLGSHIRGAAKRWRLLGYLRSHPEELRPVNLLK